MNADEDTRTAYEVLYSIEQSVSELAENQQSDGLPDELRASFSRGDLKYKILKYVAENAPCTSSDVSEGIDGDPDVTRPLTLMYRSYVIDRKADDSEQHNEYVYSPNRLTEDAISEVESQLEVTECDTTDEDQTPPRPWKEAGVLKRSFLVTLLVREHDGHPTSDDIGDGLQQFGYERSETGWSASPALSDAFEDGLVQRTPRPHKYWLTEKGKEVTSGWGPGDFN